MKPGRNARSIVHPFASYITLTGWKNIKAGEKPGMKRVSVEAPRFFFSRDNELEPVMAERIMGLIHHIPETRMSFNISMKVDIE